LNHLTLLDSTEVSITKKKIENKKTKERINGGSEIFLPDEKDRIASNKSLCTHKHTPSCGKKMPLGLPCNSKQGKTN
jgi:hypothetical protein